MADLVNIIAGLARLRGNKTIYGKMLGMFLASEEPQKLDAALGGDDISGAEAAAHSIKGIAGNLSLDALFEVSSQLMNELREGKREQATIDAFHNVYASTVDEVKATIERMAAE